MRYGTSSPTYLTAIGVEALARATGRDNVAVGVSAHERGSGSYSVAVGNYALYEPDSGAYNVAIGYQAQRESTGSNNVSLGYEAGYKVGSENVMVGYQAGRVFTGDSSVGVGYYALRLLESGEDNTGIGFRALGNNLTNASDNTASELMLDIMLVDHKIPLLALRLCMAQRPIPAASTAIGCRSLFSNSSGHYNVSWLAING